MRTTAVVLFLTGVHFGLILLCSALTFARGRTPSWALFAVSFSLSIASISLMPYWKSFEGNVYSNWTRAGAWGFIVSNYTILVFCAYELDDYIGARRDILGRALSKIAGKVLREGKKSVERQEEADHASQADSAGVPPIVETDHADSSSASSSDSQGENPMWGHPFVPSMHAPRQVHDLEAKTASEEQEQPPQVCRKHKQTNPASNSGFDLIARVLPRVIFNAGKSRKNLSPMSSSIIRFDDKTMKLFGMGADIDKYVTQYLSAKKKRIVVLYILSVCVLVAMAMLESISSGKVSGWFNLGWIVLADWILVLRVFPSNSHTNRRTDEGEGEAKWIKDIHVIPPTAPLWVVLLMLLGCRAILVTVPNWLSFAAQCVSYVFCSTYLCTIILDGYGTIGTFPKLPMKMFLSLTTFLILNTVVVGLAAWFAPVTPQTSRARVFKWEQHVVPISEWIIGLASGSFVMSFASVYYCVRFKSKSLTALIIVYTLFCLTGIAIDCIVANKASIEFGVFVSVAFLFPYFLCFSRTIQMSFLLVKKSRGALVGLETVSFLILLGWTFALKAVSPYEVTFLLLVAAIEFHCCVCFAVAVCQVYNCVILDLEGKLSFVFALCLYLAVLPICFLSAVGTTEWINSPLAGTMISLLLLASFMMFLVSSLKFGDVGWDTLVFAKSKFVLERCMFLTCICGFAGAAILTVMFFGFIAATWVATTVVLALFVITALEVQFFQRFFTHFEKNVRVTILTALSFVLFMVALALSVQPNAPMDEQSESQDTFYDWTQYFIAASCLFVFALMDYVFSMFNSQKPNEITSPSEEMFGLPVVKLVIERKGGELYVHNTQVYVCVLCFAGMDVLGFVVALAGFSNQWGTVLSGMTTCLTILLAFYLKHFRLNQFRSDLARGGSVAEDAFAHVLKDTLKKIRQFSTHTKIFHLSTAQSRWLLEKRSKLEEKQRSLAFFFLLFTLASKRKVRLARWKREQARVRGVKSFQEPVSLTVDDRSSSRVATEATSACPSLPGPSSSNTQALVQFLDPVFPPSNTLVFEEWNDEDASVADEFVLWLRPSEISCGSRWGLRLPDEGDTETSRVDPRQVKQGNVANCWLLSALSVVALRAELFDRVLPARAKSLEGRYIVRVFDFISGDWKNVEIDDLLPCDPDTKLPMFASSRSGNVFWMSIIEKAFAKRMGGWTHLHEGQVHRALVDLTGGFSQLFSLEEDFELVESGGLWATLLALARAGELLVLGSTRTAHEFGLVDDHAYAVLSVVEVHDSRGRHRLMQLQDPWGKSEWRGTWSESDKLSWTPRAKWIVQSQSEKVFGVDPQSKDASSPASQEQDGTFWMEFEDVLFHFQWLFACRLFSEKWVHHDVTGEWNYRTAGGPPNQLKTRTNPQYRLCIPSAPSFHHPGTKHVVMFVSICNLDDLPMHPYMSLLVLHLEGCSSVLTGPVLASQVVASTGKFKDARELSIEVALPVGKEFTLLPSLNRIGEFGSFRLSCYAKVPFELTRLN